MDISPVFTRLAGFEPHDFGVSLHLAGGALFRTAKPALVNCKIIYKLSVPNLLVMHTTTDPAPFLTQKVCHDILGANPAESRGNII